MSHGVPLCLSGVTNPLALSKEMADHERRRKAMKMQRSLHANANTNQLQMRNYEIMVMPLEHADLDDFHLTAKAA
ncbi:hypothetical protein Fmac_022077 [Flemingia macrophylla]|uniref:Uncharacterized protein n=1 Tax=Flemingia macrophylla TaxID=520843 RepID=A0ABD1LYN6_9FABA